MLSFEARPHGYVTESREPPLLRLSRAFILETRYTVDPRYNEIAHSNYRIYRKLASPLNNYRFPVLMTSI